MAPWGRCVSQIGFRVSGFGFRVSGFGFRVSGVGFRVHLGAGALLDLGQTRGHVERQVDDDTVRAALRCRASFRVLRRL